MKFCVRGKDPSGDELVQAVFGGDTTHMSHEGQHHSNSLDLGFNLDRVLIKLEEARKREKPFDLIFLNGVYRAGDQIDQVPDVERAVKSIKEISPESEVLFFLFNKERVPQVLQGEKFFTLDREIMTSQPSFDDLIERALGGKEQAHRRLMVDRSELSAKASIEGWYVDFRARKD